MDEVALNSPLQEALLEWAAQWRPPAPEATRPGAAEGHPGPLELESVSWGAGGATIVATLGSVELEYAAIRKGCGVFDAANRGTIELRGDDRLAFLEGMTTQKIADMDPPSCRLTFLLERTGRIVAEVGVIALADRLLLDVDVTVTESVAGMLRGYVIADDVEVEDVTADWHRLWIDGPGCQQALGYDVPGAGTAVEGDRGIVVPSDRCAEVGCDLFLARDDAIGGWERLLEGGGRPIGWYALNMARIEARVPMFMIDYDTSSLPHETGVIASHVAFDKGCYVGQEVVARMESRGRWGRSLVALSLLDERLPVAGAQVWATKGSPMDDPAGTVTSSTPSPMAGGRAIALAMVKRDLAEAGATVWTWADGEMVEATVSLLGVDDE